ncbi:hypothetical protein GGR56DRAFT_614707 [Xylariaceae sp. FL0804]|nr:hypothetical protein GGR56DRAFT_614707 [Xylariaceae sp. FL0804]
MGPSPFEVPSDAEEYSDDDDIFPHRPVATRDSVLQHNWRPEDGVNCDDYSDDDINILHEIVTRAEVILNEELSIDARLPTHALFLAYDEVINARGIARSNEDHISRLVFMVGGVKTESTIKGKFNAVMKRMNISVVTDGDDGPQDTKSGNEPQYINGHDEAQDTDGHDEPQYSDGDDDSHHTEDDDTSHPTSKDDDDDDDDDAANYSENAKLAKLATAFREKHHTKFAAIAAIRKWQKATPLVDPRMEFLAAQTHRNLTLSRAFTTWYNRAEEEAQKSEMANKAYEMQLKAKAFAGARAGPGAARAATAAPAAPVSPAAPSAPFAPPAPSAPSAPSTIRGGAASTAARTIAAASTADRAVAAAPATTRTPAAAPTASRSTSVVPVATRATTIFPTAARPMAAAPAAVRTAAVTATAEDENNDDDDDYDDENDERTMLARRHILRFRYFGAWAEYTAENSKKIEEFQVETKKQRLSNLVSAWRSRKASQEQQITESQIQHEHVDFYQKANKAVPLLREEAGKAEEREQLLKHYADRAFYYNRTTQALGTWREKAQKAAKAEQLQEHYGERADFYYKTTKIVPAWRAKTREAVEKRQLQEHYSQRADYYYSARETVLEWRERAQQRRKERMREAYLETRRMVKKGMGERCFKQWREKLGPSYQRYEAMNANLAEAVENREWRQKAHALSTWRQRAREERELAFESGNVVKQKALGQWREKSAAHQEVQTEAEQHWEDRAKSRALKGWNLSALQNANRPEMVAHAQEKQERRQLRQGLEGWRSAANSKAKDGGHPPPTPGRPQIFLGSLGRRETTTPLAPVRKKSLRVSWAA